MIKTWPNVWKHWFAERTWFKMFIDQFTGIVTDVAYIPSYKTTGDTVIILIDNV